MAIFNKIDNLPQFKNAVVTIGTFDGVHQGHQRILQEVVRHTREVAGESIVVTFEPHPRRVLFPGSPVKLLTSLQQKLKLISETGIEHIVVAPFTKEFSELSGVEYIRDFLVARFRPESIIIGYDHHFGHDRKGNITLLKQFQDEFGYKIYEIPAQLVDEAAVSSTKIRAALLEGNVQEAATMMNRHYSISGRVTQGDQLGRKIGFPTANIKPSEPDQLITGNGVYAVRVNHKGTLFNGMMNIGYRPTVSGSDLRIEVNILDFNQDIYNDELEILFIKKLRDEKKFDGLDALKLQLQQDKENALAILNK